MHEVGISAVDPALPPRSPSSFPKTWRGGILMRWVSKSVSSLLVLSSALPQEEEARSEVFSEAHFVSSFTAAVRTGSHYSPAPYRQTLGAGAPGQSMASGSSPPPPQGPFPEKYGEPSGSHLLGWSLVQWCGEA